MKKIHVLVGLALAGAFSAAQALPVDFSGYARGGYGVNTSGGRQTCFSIKGARNVETHYRLANECDYVIETNLNSTLAKNADGSEWHVNFMLKNWRAWSMAATSDNGMGNQGPSTSFAQAYAYGQGLPILNGGSVWAGRRYYNRVQLGINDHFLENDDGDGFGFDNIGLGGGVKLNLGVTDNGSLNGDNTTTSSGTTVPINNYFGQKLIASVTDIPTFAGSKLQVRAKIHRISKADYVTYNATTNTYTTTTLNSANTSGYSFLFFHETPNILGGTLSAGLRFSKRTHEGNAKSTLLFVQQSGNIGHMGYDGISEFKTTKAVGSSIKDNWFSLGGRVDAQLYGPIRGVVEAGYDTVKRSGDVSANNTTYNFSKLTLAGEFSAGDDAGSRPVVRLYYTYGKWNRNAQKDLQIGGSVYANKTSGSAVGAQYEAWW